MKIFYSRPEEPESSPRPFVMNELLWALNVGSLYFLDHLTVVTNSDSFCFDLEFLHSVRNFSVWKEENCFSEYKTGKTELSQNEVRRRELLSYCLTHPSVTQLDVCSP